MKKLTISSLSFVLCLAVGAPVASWAQAQAPAKEEPKQEAPKRDQRAIDYERAIKDLVKHEGAFTIYERRREVLLEIPEEKLGKLFYVQAAFHHGFSQDPVQAGSPLGGQAVDVYRFDRKGDELWLVRPNLRYRWTKDDPFAIAAERSMPEAILADFRVEQYNPETKRVLINATPLFNGELNFLGMLVTILGGSQYSLDRDKSGIDRVIQGGDITTVRMNYHFFSPRPGMGGAENPLAALLGGFNNQAEDQRSLPLKMTWTLQFRPEASTYMPRVADPRVGYFTQDYWALDRFFRMDRTQRFINRWHLEKKDPKAAISEPVKPIVWTIDHSIPERWRPAVRDGILRWNRAFEALGFRNAIQVVDAPKDDPNYDHADGRRNVVRFTMTEDSGYAIALFRTDPFTGQILNASVTLDANFVNYINAEYLGSTIPSATGMPMKLDLARQSLTRRQANVPAPKELLLGLEQRRNAQADEVMRRLGWTPFFCSVGREHMMNASMNFVKMRAAGLNISGQKYVESYLADVVAHEVGHCLGLRHNFVSSTNLTTAQLGDAACCDEHGVAASVMEYTPTNVMAILNNMPNALHNRSIGVYDMHAIRYGYMDIAADTPDGERYALSQVARRGGEKGLGFMTDEDADGVDPYVVRFDLAKDPLNYKDREIFAARKARRWAVTTLPRVGESYTERNMIILRTLLLQFRESMAATTFVTGVVGNRNFRGDVNERPTLRPVEPAVARQAMQMISREALSVTSVDVPDAVLQTMSLDYNTGEGNQFTAPLRSVLSFNQQMILAQLLSVNAMEAVLENSFKMPNDRNAYTIDEHVGMVTGAVFSEIGQNRRISSLRRELQSFALEAMITQASASGISAEIRRVAEDGIQRVKSSVDRQLKSTAALDTASISHLSSMSRAIQRYQNRMMVVQN